MTRKEHLKFCRVCQNRKMDLQQGLVCKITGKIAAFDNTCHDYKRDELEEERLRLQRLEIAGGIEDGDPTDFKKNKFNGQLFIVIGSLLFLVSIVLPFQFIIIPTGCIMYGIFIYRKGVEQEKIMKEKN